MAVLLLLIHMMTVDSGDRVGSVDRRDGITSAVSTPGHSAPAHITSLGLGLLMEQLSLLCQV